MNTLLNVPYSEKDLAKGKGAKWNPNIKSWYTDDIAKLPGLLQWAYPHNIICENLYILKMNHTCWKCKGSTEVVLFATDKSYAKEDRYKTYICRGNAGKFKKLYETVFVLSFLFQSNQSNLLQQSLHPVQ